MRIPIGSQNCKFNNFNTEAQEETKMKQLLSMPSTKPQQFLYTDFSVVTPADNPKLAITTILNYIKNVLKLRTYLCFRDMEELFQSEPQFFAHTLGADSAQQLWSQISRSDDAQLQQKEIVGFLTKIMISLTNLKNHYAQSKKYEKFAETKYAIEWLQDRIVQMQATIRDKLKQTAIKKRSQNQLRKQLQFEEGASYLKEKLQMSLREYELELKKRHRKQDKANEQAINQRIEKEYFTFRPSKFLSEAKDESLLAKLAPYKSEKKRPFECKSLQRKLLLTVEKGKQKAESAMEQFKEVEKQKMRRRHMLEREVYLSKLEGKNNQTIAQLEMRRSELNKSEHIKMQRLIEENNRLSKERVESLRKSLRTYSMRNESKQIGEIAKHHRENIQFVNNIEDIAETSRHLAILEPKYVTLDVLSDETKQRKADRYSNERLESKIIRRIKNRSLIDQYDQDMGSPRKSLVNLYDEHLKQL